MEQEYLGKNKRILSEVYSSVSKVLRFFKYCPSFRFCPHKLILYNFVQVSKNSRNLKILINNNSKFSKIFLILPLLRLRYFNKLHWLSLISASFLLTFINLEKYTKIFKCFINYYYFIFKLLRILKIQIFSCLKFWI